MNRQPSAGPVPSYREASLGQKLRRAGVIWVIALAAVIAASQGGRLLGLIGIDSTFGLLEAVSFFGSIILAITSLYLIFVVVHFILQRLFWRVGRRLFLSYLLIGGLPFVFFAIVLLVTGYVAAGVLSQTSMRSHRQNALSRLDQWNVEYALTGQRPSGTFKSMELYDSREGKTKALPEWLRKGTFLGLTASTREEPVRMVSARTYESNGSWRTIVLVQPLNAEWKEFLSSAYRIRVEQFFSEQSAPGSFTIDGDADPDEKNEESEIWNFLQSALRGEAVFWGDMSPLIDWETGENREDALFTLFLSPWSNLLDFYFLREDYLNVLLAIIFGLASVLGIIYFFATLLAGALIFSISRAVNRIEKGTKAVERGDFSYRIGMRPRSQLGEMAVSFDSMTESIASLLVRVAEQERLQSEIDIAASIQRNLLPKDGPTMGGVSFSAHFEPTASIGGDYYDVFNLDSRRLAVAIGDVSGHGLSTGLVMAMVKAAMSTLVEEGAAEAALFARLNDLVMRSTEKRTFMTLGFTIFDLAGRTIRHTNAGHLYPYLLRRDLPPIPIEAPSLPLGVKPSLQTFTVERDFEEGDTVVYLSDGIIESLDDAGDPFGFERIETILGEAAGEPPADIQAKILNAVAEFTGERPADDDRTVMIIRFDRLPVVGAAETADASLAMVGSREREDDPR